MAEIASIYQLCQIGPETTPGTEVNAGKVLSSLQIAPSIKVDIQKYRPTGYKYPTLTALNKEWIEAGISGPINYEELPYLLCSALKNVTPTGAGTAKAWSVAPATSAADTAKTYTVEQGDATRAHLFTYGIVKDLGLTFSRSGCEVRGMMLGQALQDGITLTASPAQIALEPLLPTQVTAKLASTQAGLAGASALTRLFKIDWDIKDRFGPIFPLTGSADWAAHVEIEPNLEIKFLMAADSSGMAQLTNLRANSIRWLRVAAQGSLISGVDYYTFQLDQPFKITDVSEFRDEEGVFCVEWTATGAHDAAWGKAMQFDVQCTLASL